ncbi:MAG: hypothetical protein Kow0029_30980 [Candidatus Rifleibacteriota bacterium]
MEEKHPFQLRDHGHKIIEIIVRDPEIKPDHKTIETIKLLKRKFEQIILTLEETASLHESLLPELLKIGEFGGLKIVAPRPEQVSFDLHGLLKFNDVISAVRRIAGERMSERILKQLGLIAPMRTSAYNLLQMMRNPEVQFEEIEEEAAKDPNLVARMLKTANTAYFSRRLPVETLKAAVTYLGLEGIRQLLVHEMFEHFTRFFVNQRDRLAHMKRCSHLAAHIGKLIKADLPTIGKMRVAGLLHDLGSLAFCYYDPQKYNTMMNMVRKEHVAIHEAETRIFGVNHQELGALYAKEMGLPEYILSAIANHHDTEIDNENFVLMSVICANGFLNDKIEGLVYTVYEPYFKNFADEIDSKNPVLKKLIEQTKNHGADFSAGHAENTASKAETFDETDDLPEDSEKIPDEESATCSFDESLWQQHAFKPMQFYGLLKEELDQFILSGAGSS